MGRQALPLLRSFSLDFLMLERGSSRRSEHSRSIDFTSRFNPKKRKVLACSTISLRSGVCAQSVEGDLLKS
jgi:hypothetical protein